MTHYSEFVRIVPARQGGFTIYVKTYEGGDWWFPEDWFDDRQEAQARVRALYDVGGSMRQSWTDGGWYVTDDTLFGWYDNTGIWAKEPLRGAIDWSRAGFDQVTALSRDHDDGYVDKEAREALAVMQQRKLNV